MVWSGGKSARLMIVSENEAPLTALRNFGGNQTWTSRRYRPADEQAVLEILARHAGDTIRALGSLHSWSDIATGADVSIDLSRLDAVEPYSQGGQEFVRVGAGCKLQRLLDRLHAATDRTLPTLGAIKRQAIAGAIATGTHGSGRESFSHFVTKVRLAAYDPATGEPAILEYAAGDELKAARCGLGCMGIILSVDLQTVPKYQVAEVVRSRRTVEEILATYAQWPLTQFVLFPHAWRWLAFERKPAGADGGWLKRHFFRINNLVMTDIFFHLGVVAGTFVGPAAQKALMHSAPALIIKNVERVDDAEHVLTLEHHYFRHEEMEVFVKESDLAEVVELVQTVVATFAGDGMVPADIDEKLRALGLGEELARMRGSYALAYPIVFRRVMPEDALVSMGSSAAEPYYSMSFFTYDAPARRAPYYGLCSFLARCLNRLVDARLHWGKHFPLQFADIARSYPDMETFRDLCRRTDRNGVFRNAYTTRVLDLPPGARA
jgi:L-gulono-1,4-lactone dehydrogenase